MFWLLPAMSNIESRGNSRKFFGRIQKQFSSSSLVESNGNSKEFFGWIQKQFSNGFTVESRHNFKHFFWLNPQAIFKQFNGRIQAQFQAFFLVESRRPERDLLLIPNESKVVTYIDHDGFRSGNFGRKGTFFSSQMRARLLLITLDPDILAG